ncbi:MAG: permease, partial [Pseudomonadota bacterium]
SPAWPGRSPATTAATLGVSFAVGKTAAAFGLGLWGGAITSIFARRDWATASLRSNRIVGKLSQGNCGAALPFDARIWKDRQRKDIFRENFAATTRLILICLIPAFAAEYALNAVLQPDALSAYVGSDVWWAIPFAVFVGAPAYLDGYAALPLTRGLMDHGMSPGAAMAFLVSGGVVSIWGAMAIFPVLRLKPFLLYLALALSGSLAAGYVFDWVV